ncbi:aminotransferase class V-fold PLP-dependent enzyme [Flaviaesturariibacter terrae]
MKNTILVLGGDGYYGWPISLKLAVTHPDTKIIIADNEWRRNTVRKIGSDSLIPIARPVKRLAAFRDLYGQDNLQYVQLDVNSAALEDLIREEQPHTIYHMAQQCSAPYSMLGLAESLYTINNNEGNNMRLLWAVRKHVPEAHVIKMGSMGEYATCGGIDIAEGYFHPEFNGRKAVNPLPFPRQSDDVYHISKINDSNYISMACRKWGLRVTEVMQSTLFGVYIDEMQDCEDLYTRFDYDDIFGTVVNRFLTQAMVGHPLTVYGKGNQTTGIMPMKDAVNSLELIAGTVPDKGAHKVVNHVTKANCSINELAESVRELGEELGYAVTINHVFDPRSESDAVKHNIRVMTEHIDNNLAASAFTDVLRETFTLIARQESRVQPHAFTHHIHAFKGQYDCEEPATEVTADVVSDEASWRVFRENNFPSGRINLNPGTLGTVSAVVKKVRVDTASTQLEGSPLGLYERGRTCVAAIRDIAAELWPSAGYELVVANGTSQTINLLALALLRAFGKNGGNTCKVVTSRHEHPGGIGVFEQLPEFEVHYLEDDVLHDEERFRSAIGSLQPQVSFLSHVYYASGNLAPYAYWSEVIRAEAPQCKLILDVTQSIGLYELPFGTADVLVGSLHKWIFGPYGSGLTWLRDEFREWLGGLFWNGMDAGTEPQRLRLAQQGGQDFHLYAEILESLRLYRNVGPDLILRRSGYLSDLFRQQLEEVLTKYEIPYKILNKNGAAPMLSIAFYEPIAYDLYTELNSKEIHCKCIMNYAKDGQQYHILRFGLPYYETTERLNYAVQMVDGVLKDLQKVVQMPAVVPQESAAPANKSISAVA